VCLAIGEAGARISVDPIYYRCINLLSNLSSNIHTHLTRGSPIPRRGVRAGVGADLMFRRNRAPRRADQPRQSERQNEGGAHCRRCIVGNVQKIDEMAFPGSGWQIEQDEPDAGLRRPLRRPPPPPSPVVARDPLNASFAPFRGAEERKLPAVPGRSFGCGGAIKNSPVSGAWIADGGHVVDDRLSRPYLAPVSLFIPRVRLYRRSIGICISNFAARRTLLFPSA
jgi:hypothetical protein